MFRFGNHYYEGSSFLESLIITIIGALLGGVIAGYIFYLTIKHNKIEEEKKLRSNYLNKIKFLINLLAKVLEESKKQIVNYKKQLSNIQENPFEYYTVTLLASNQLKRIIGIDSQGLFEAFVFLNNGLNNERVEKYNKLLERIDFLELGTHQMFSLNEANIKFIGDQQSLMKSKVDILYTEFLSYNEVLNLLNIDYWRLFQKYVGTGKLDIKAFNDNFLITLFAQLKDLLPKIGNENVKLTANKLLGELRSITVIIDYYRVNNLYYTEMLKELYEQLEEVGGKISIDLKELKKLV